MIARLARRQVESKYRGAMLGMSWAVFEPLVQLAIYAFVFSFVFRARWGTGMAEDASRGEFALFLFSGLTIYAIFADAVNESPRSVLSAEQYVKQMAFPSEILAWVSLAAALFKFMINVALLMTFYRLTLGHPPITVLLLPVVILPVLLLTLGVSWLFGSLGVYLRDIGQLVGLLTTLVLFLSPIFYPASMIPDRYRSIYLMNPFARVLEASKQVIFEGHLPNLAWLLGLIALGWVAAWLGHIWFVRTKAGFADVL